MKVTVLYGGPSSEREISLKSGKAVADGLRAAGHEVTEIDIHPSNLDVMTFDTDVVFPALHGEFGESGELQAELEKRGIPFVGSGSAASNIGIDKLETKRVWQQHNIPTPAWHIATRDDPTLGSVQAPCAVKAIRSGSSIDVHICHNEEEALKAVRSVTMIHGKALVEQFIAGMEITVGILFDRTLPPIRIAVERGFFDFTAKYSSTQGAEHRFDTGLSDATLKQIEQICLKAHQVIGCRDLSRIDVMIDKDQKPYLLEVNTMPGFTQRSLLPEMAGKAGISFEQLVDQLVKAAAARK